MAKPWKESRWGAYYDKAFGYSWYGETGYLDKIPELSSVQTLHRSHVDLIFKEDLWGSVRSTKDLERLLPGAISSAAGGDSELAQKLSLPENFYGEFVKICEEIRGKCNFETLAELGEVYRRYYRKETLAYKDSSGKYYLDKPAGIDTEPVESAVVGNVLDLDGRDFNKLMEVTGLQKGAYGLFLNPLPANGNGSPLWSSNPNLPNTSTGGYGYGPQYALIWQFAQTNTYAQLVERLSGTSYKGTVLGPGGGVSQAFEDARLREAGKQEEIDKRLAQRTAESNRLEEGQKADDLTEEEIRQAISFENQRLLAQNVGNLADANIRRGYAKEKYKRSYMIDGDPYKLINLLTLRENGADFSKITVPQASALVPQISLFKVLYNDNGSYEGETRILFKTFLELQKQTSQATGVETTLGGARSGVGIKSFEWELNGTNIANVKSDITAKLVLYFQNFDDLLQANENGFKYVDLLVRPSKEDLEDDSIDTKETAEFINVDTRELDPKFYEIKAEVGWASNDSYLGSPINKKAIQNAIKSQKHTFFLTLVDHEFEINQDGTFMLTINYRARLDGMLNDVRADVLMTEESKRQISELTDRLDDAKKKDPEREKKIKEQIKQVKDEQRHASNTDILNKLLVQGKIFIGYYDKDTLRSVDYDLGKLDAKTLNLTTDGLPTPANEDFVQRINEDAVSQSNADAAKARGALVLDEDKCAAPDIFSLQGASEASSFVLPALTGGPAAGLTSALVGIAGTERSSNIVGQLGGAIVTAGSAVGSGIVNFFGGSSPVEEESPDIQEIDADEYSCFGAGYASQTGTEVYRKPNSLDDLEQLGLYESNGRYYIPYFFLGDLIDIVSQKALDVLAADEDSSPGIFSDPRTKNIKIVLGSIGIQNILDNDNPGRKIVNIGDIPVSVDMYRDFWARRVTKKERDSYSLNQFIKDCLEEFVLDAIGYQDFDGQRKQMFRIKDATISLPAKMTGGSPLDPLYDRIKETNGDKSTGLTVGVSADGGEIRKLNVTDTLTFGSRISIDALKDPTPLLKVGEARFTAEDTFQYKVFYIQNVLSSNMRGNRREDESNGIMHLGLGEDRGLVKQASFSRTDLQGLREQRVIERDRLDPLSHLADVYNVNFTMFGNTLFWPGQYLFFNPIGFGSRFGSPLDPRSISRVMGLGGYHKVIKVSSYIEAAKFETTVEALYETSGGDKSELVHGSVEGTESNDSGNIQAAQTSQPIATQSNVGNINKKE